MVVHLKKYFLLYTLLPLLILTIAASFFRFMVSYDYLVSYEGPCDESFQSCFVYCEDEACTEPFYYSMIERNASLLRDLCGAEVNVLDCEAASSCQPDDHSCTVIYCDPAIDSDCELIDSTKDIKNLSDV